MTDDRPDPRDVSPDTGRTRKVPPLAWIIGGLLVLMIVIGALQYGGSRTTPSGGTVDQQKEALSDGYLPPTVEEGPAQAPATQPPP